MKLAALLPCLTIVTVKVEGSPYDEQNTPWLPTTILESVLLHEAYVSETSTTSLFFAARTCESFTRCSLFCQDSESSFSYWFIIADPFLDHSDQGVTKKCWARQLRGNFISDKNGVSVSAWPHNLWYHARKPDSDFLDGYYNGNIDQTLHLWPSYGAYFVIDLGSEVYIWRIKIFRSELGRKLGRFRKVSIRLGHTAETGDFSRYSELAYFNGDPTHLNFFFVVEPKPPQVGRYISVQTMSTKDLQVAHVQVQIFTKEDYYHLHQNYK